MTSKQLLIALAALGLFASCKKSSDSNSSSTANKFKSYVEEVHAGGINQTDSFNLTYDNNGRLSTMASSTQKFVYAYNGSTSVTMDYYENGQLSIHEIGYFKNGILDSTFQYNDSQDTTTEGYTYSNKNLASRTTYDYVSGHPVADYMNTYGYDVSGILLRDVQSSGGTTTTTTVYNYSDGLYTYQITTSPFAVIPQRNYLLKIQTIYDGQGNVTATINYTWVLDSSGRAIQETQTQDNGDYVIRRYHY